jgi:hypothetical protein
MVASLPAYFRKIMIYGLETFRGGRLLAGSPASIRQEKCQGADNQRSSSNDTRQPDRVHVGPSFPAAGCNEERKSVSPSHAAENFSRFARAGPGAGVVLPKTDSEIAAGAAIFASGIDEALRHLCFAARAGSTVRSLRSSSPCSQQGDGPLFLWRICCAGATARAWVCGRYL